MSRKSLKQIIGLAVVAVAAAALYLSFLSPKDAEENGKHPSEVQTSGNKRQSVKKPLRRVKLKPIASPARAKPVESDDDMKPEDRKLYNNIQSALDEGDKAAVRDLVKAALKSENPEVRKEMVTALGWFGKGVIGDLAAFLADRDADVREAAGNNWQVAVSEIDDEDMKSIVIEETLKTVNDENLTDMIASEYNGMDEKRAIESICKVIASGNAKGVKAAKEAYEFVTGEEWVSAAAARAWLQENYTPPENE